MKLKKGNMIRIKYLLCAFLIFIIFHSLFQPNNVESLSLMNKFIPKPGKGHVPDKCKRYMSKPDWEKYKQENKLPPETVDDGSFLPPDDYCMKLRTTRGGGGGVPWKAPPPLKLEGDRCNTDSECESNECTCCTWFRYTCN